MKALPSLNDTEWSTYDVILLSSRLGARPNPLENWKHAIFYYWVIGDPEAIGASFRGIKTYKSAWLSRNPEEGGAGRFLVCSY
jgi:hypothetical protein